MKKTQFRIRLYPGANKCAELIALEAAMYNGRNENMSLVLLNAFAMTVKTLGGYQDTSIELVGENELTIDVKINGAWETVCLIQEIEVWEAVKFLDEDDLKAEILAATKYPQN